MLFYSWYQYVVIQACINNTTQEGIENDYLFLYLYFSFDIFFSCLWNCLYKSCICLALCISLQYWCDTIVWDLGWRLLKFHLLISPLQQISIYQNSRLDALNHVHIWQMSPQLSCNDTCLLWMWYHTVNMCFGSAKILGNNGMEEIGSVTPTPVLETFPYLTIH